jgi:SAM-dependent methyltransferase
MVNFEAVYAGRTPLGRHAPWDIGAPQPILVDLANRGEIRGEVLDVGCGTGENAIFFAERGYSVTGVDISPTAIERARRNAVDRSVLLTLDVANALELVGYDARFDTIVDCGLFDSCPESSRWRYTDALRRVARPGARVFLLELSASAARDMHRKFMRRGIPACALRDLPKLTPADLRAAFDGGWRERFLHESTMRVQPTGATLQTDVCALFACFERT